MKRFISKRKHNNIIFYLGIFLVGVSLSIRYLYINNKINDDTIVKILVSDTFPDKNDGYLDASNILKYALNIDLEDVKEEDKEEVVIKEETSIDPIVYIYNTHQEEKYKSSYVENYNIKPSVLLGSKILKEYLKNEGIISIVEESNIPEKVRTLNWSYGKSYKVARMMMEEALKNNPTLKYFIDFHRDSSKYSETTTEINNEKYARLLFVIGLENKDYEKNLQLVNSLANKIKEYDKSLYRGIMKKSGPKVNGVYNQDFSPKAFLIEVGGQYNNISEVNNTLKVLAKILANYIKEDNNE